jgi:Fic family protein
MSLSSFFFFFLIPQSLSLSFFDACFGGKGYFWGKCGRGMKSCVPPRLPLRGREWGKIRKQVDKTRKVVNRLNAAVEKNSVPLALKKREATAAVASQKGMKGLALCYKKALEIGQRNIQTRPVTFALIKRMHATINRDSVKPERGHFRKRQNWIGPEGRPIEEAYFYPPAPEILPRALRNWKDYLRYPEKDPLLKIAIIFAQFLILHPFMDGNGRVARALLPLLFFKEKVTAQPLLYLSVYFEKARATYCQKLFDITAKNDWEGWILFFLEGVEKEARYEGRLARAKRQKN